MKYNNFVTRFLGENQEMKEIYNYNKGQKAVVSKPIGCIIAGIFILILLGSFLGIILVLRNAGMALYKALPTRGKIILIGIILFIICRIAIKIVRFINLQKVIKNGTAIRKTVKIVNFKYGHKSGGGEHDSTSGYYVILSDGENEYKGMFHRGAEIRGKTDEELMDDKFYIEEGVILDLNNRNNTKYQLNQKISNLTLQEAETNLFQKWKIFKNKQRLKNHLFDLESRHLYTEEGDFYIGEEYTILIDPKDLSNYTFEDDRV